MKRALLTALVALALAGCDFGGRYAEYCEQSKLCDGIEGDNICIPSGGICDATTAPCCAGLACDQNACVPPVPHLAVSADRSVTYSIDSSPAPKEHQITVVNRGFASTGVVTVTLSSDALSLGMDASACTGRVYAPGESCSVTIPATKPGSYAVEVVATDGSESASATLPVTVLEKFTLRCIIVGGGYGSGISVTSSPPGLSWSSLLTTQSGSLPSASPTFTASSSPGWAFEWVSPCTGTDPSCTLQPGQSEATMNCIPWLTVTSQGTAGVVVVEKTNGDQIGFAYAGNSDAVPVAGPVRLIAEPGSLHTLAGWSGACADAGTNIECDLDVESVTQATATFQ